MADRELTFVRSHDHCEVMVSAEQVYAYADSLPTIPGVRWLEGRNPLFRYADDQTKAIDYIRAHFNACDEA